MAELHTLPEPENRTAYALASDYAALEAERDTLRALLERCQETLDPHRDAVLWGDLCAALRASHGATHEHE